MLPREVCAMQCYCLCNHVLPVHYSGILKKNKQSCSLILFNFFWSKLLHLQIFFFFGGEGLEFPVTNFCFSRFWKEWHHWEGPYFPATLAKGAQTLLLLFWFAINSFSSLLSTAIWLVCSWLMTDEMWSEGPPKSHVNWSWQKILTVPFWTADAVQNGLAGGRLTTGDSSQADRKSVV